MNLIRRVDAKYNSELAHKGKATDLFSAAANSVEAMIEALGSNTTVYLGLELEKALARKPGITYKADVDTIRVPGALRATVGMR